MLRRGFKSEAERIAVEARELVGVPAYAPLPARQLAAAMNVAIAGLADVPGMPAALTDLLLGEHSRLWSGLTFSCDGKPFVVYNTTHAPDRQESDLMHELAHIWCKHKPGTIEPVGRFPFALRSHDEAQEDEAKWLGGCFQLPRESLLYFLQRKYDAQQIAVHFNASEEMVRYRTNMSGVKYQLARSAPYKKW